MSMQARHEGLDFDVARGVEGVIPSLRWRYVTRLLEVTVWLLVTVFGIQMFGLWVKFLQWGTLLQFPQ